METFTLIVWITLGIRVEERYIPDLSEIDCAARLEELRQNGARIDTLCIRSGYPRPSRPGYQCPDCRLVKGRGTA